MNSTLAFSARNLKELLRDPLNFAFALGFPIIVMLLLSAINAGIPEAVFPISTLAPGMAVFGLSFITLFSATLIAKDRGSSFLLRLFASPLSSNSFIVGYTLPLLPLAIMQTVICFLTAFALGLPLSIHVIPAIIILIPAAILFIAMGLLCGTVFTDKQVGGICGALLTNLCAWLSGAWFDLSLVGGVFEKIAYMLPFAHALDASRAALTGNYADVFPHFWWVIAYAAVILALAIIVFKKKMKQ